MSRPITPISPARSSLPMQTEPSLQSTHPVSARPVSNVGTQHTDAPSNYDHSNAYLDEPGAMSQGGLVHGGDAMPGEEAPNLPRSNSQLSGSQSFAPSRGGTLKKKPSLHKSASLKRTASKRSSYAGSVRSMKLGEKEKYGETEETNSVFYCPVPTSGNPTDILANRFQAWRKVLKDIINYFRDLHKTYEMRSKALMSTSNVVNNITMPPNFLSSGGIGEAHYILCGFQKQALSEANKARDLENEVIVQLTGLRSDLQQKIKEIKSLSGDFKNSVDKEQDTTKRSVRALQEALGMVDTDAASTSGKGDPFLIKLGVDKQIERQIDEENYLHRAYLNLEASGRELESIVVGEIQKAYNVLASILRREADDAYDTAEKLKEGPLAMSKDHEWDEFTTNNDQMVDPRRPIRQVANIVYPGKEHPAAIEVRSGMLERKSKYLKNYTPGWYILSPTHLHEFKSADRVTSQTPVMSLYLPEQKLGTHSEPGSSSHKFMLKGRQTGSMHRGHAWVFRAETYDTMLAWYEDIKELTSKRGEERNEFVRRTHARSLSGNSMKPASIISSEGGMEEDEADRIAFAGEQSVRGNSITHETDLGAAAALGAATGLGVQGTTELDDSRSEAGWRPPQQRPAPGGRFPSDLNIERGLQAPMSPSSGASSDQDRDVIAAAGSLPGSGVPFSNTVDQHTELQPGPSQSLAADTMNTNSHYTTGQHPNIFPAHAATSAPQEATSQYGEWMAPIAAGVGGAAVGAGVMHYREQRQQRAPENIEHQMDGAAGIPAPGQSSAPIVVASPAPADAPSGPRAMSESTTAPSSAAGNATSSGTDTATLSTVPTSTGFPAPNESMFDANGVFTGPRTAKTAPTEYVIRPTERSKSHSTISDLHVPGEYPATPGLSEGPKLYGDVIQS